MAGRPTVPCPHCGVEIPEDAAVCRECGSDATTGWSDTAEDDATELPEEMTDDDHDSFIAHELPRQESLRLRRRRLLIAWLGVSLAILFLIWALRARRS